jgi:hypothetical protein
LRKFFNYGARQAQPIVGHWSRRDTAKLDQRLGRDVENLASVQLFHDGLGSERMLRVCRVREPYEYAGVQ